MTSDITSMECSDFISTIVANVRDEFGEVVGSITLIVQFQCEVCHADGNILPDKVCFKISYENESNQFGGFPCPGYYYEPQFPFEIEGNWYSGPHPQLDLDGILPPPIDQYGFGDINGYFAQKRFRAYSDSTCSSPRDYEGLMVFIFFPCYYSQIAALGFPAGGSTYVAGPHIYHPNATPDNYHQLGVYAGGLGGIQGRFTHFFGSFGVVNHRVIIDVMECGGGGFGSPSPIGQSPKAKFLVGKSDRGFNSKGPGTELKKILGRLGFFPTLTCSCDSYVALMNEWGVGGCKVRKHEIAGWLKLAASSVIREFKVEDPIEAFYPLVEEAIRLAEDPR